MLPEKKERSEFGGAVRVCATHTDNSFVVYRMVVNSVAGITQGKGEIGKEFTKEVTFALNFRGKRNVSGRERQMANPCNNLPS